MSKDRLFIIGITSTLFCAVSAVLLAHQTHIIDIERLFSAHHQTEDEEDGQGTAAATGAQGQGAGGTAKTGATGTPAQVTGKATDSKTGKEALANGPDTGKRSATHSIEIKMTPSPTAQPEEGDQDPDSDSDIISVHYVTLHAMCSDSEWPGKNYTPCIGDTIQVSVKEDLTYELIVTSFNSNTECEEETLYGIVLETKRVLGGSASLEIEGRKLLLTISDPKANRAYIISYVNTRDEYKIEEIDLDKRNGRQHGVLTDNPFLPGLTFPTGGPDPIRTSEKADTEE